MDSKVENTQDEFADGKAGFKKCANTFEPLFTDEYDRSNRSRNDSVFYYCDRNGKLKTDNPCSACSIKSNQSINQRVFNDSMSMTRCQTHLAINAKIFVATPIA